MTAMESTEWAERFTKSMGQAIDTARQGKSDQWIADRTKELGHPLSRTAVSEYRRGIRKSMPITDLMVLAAALEVPPVALLFPGLATKQVEALPGESLTSIEALQWFTGERDRRFEKSDHPLFSTSISKFHIGDSPEFKLLKASREFIEEFHEVTGSFLALAPLLKASGQALDFEELRGKLDLNQTKRRLDELAERIRKLGGTAEVEAPWGGPDHGDH